MLRVIEYEEGLESAWRRYIEESPAATIAHDIDWRHVIKKGLGHEPKYLVAVDGSRVQGVLPLFLVRTWWQTRYLISIPWLDYGGICACDRETARLLVEEACNLAKRNGVQFIELRSKATNGLECACRTDKVTFLLRLHPDSELLWNKLDPKLRNQIKKSQKMGLSVQLGGIDSLDQFYSVFSWKMHDLGTPVWGKRLFRLALEAFPKTAQIATVTLDDRVIAAALVLSFKDCLYVPSAASYREYLKYCPNQALYWSLIDLGCRKGFNWFDFGRSSLDSGTYKFKEQWVPQPLSLCWQYPLFRGEEITSVHASNSKYRFLTNQWRKLPRPVANLLGPFVIRNFP